MQKEINNNIYYYTLKIIGLWIIFDLLGSMGKLKQKFFYCETPQVHDNKNAMLVMKTIEDQSKECNKIPPHIYSLMVSSLLRRRL